MVVACFCKSLDYESIVHVEIPSNFENRVFLPRRGLFVSQRNYAYKFSELQSRDSPYATIIHSMKGKQCRKMSCISHSLHFLILNFAFSMVRGPHLTIAVVGDMTSENLAAL